MTRRTDPVKCKIESLKTEKSIEDSKRHIQMLEKNPDQFNEPIIFKGRLNLRVTRVSPQDLSSTKESSKKVSNVNTTRNQSELSIVP